MTEQDLLFQNKIFKLEMDIYSRLFGRLMANFKSIEFHIRTSLAFQNKTNNLSKLKNINIGQMVEEDDFTNYKTFEDLTRQYNSISKQKIPPKIIDLRNAFAYGQMWHCGDNKSSEIPSMHVAKFSKAEDGEYGLKVDFYAEMDYEYMKKMIQETDDILDNLIP